MSVVLILGATSDIAEAIARKMAEEKHDIQLAARNAQRLDTLRSDLSIRYQCKCDTYEFDARETDTHAHFWNSLSPRPDICICVFGYLGDQKVAETDWAQASAIIETNYTGAVSILNLAANDYAAAGSGCIVGISSVAGERGRQSNYIYGSAKAGFTAYLSGLRNRLFHQKVHVLTVQPGFVYTKMTENLDLPKLLTAQPEEVGEAVKKAIARKKNVIYVKWFWRWIMFIIKSIPEGIFKKLKL